MQRESRRWFFTRRKPARLSTDAIKREAELSQAVTKGTSRRRTPGGFDTRHSANTTPKEGASQPTLYETPEGPSSASFETPNAPRTPRRLGFRERARPCETAHWGVPFANVRGAEKGPEKRVKHVCHGRRGVGDCAICGRMQRLGSLRRPRGGIRVEGCERRRPEGRPLREIFPHERRHRGQSSSP